MKYLEKTFSVCLNTKKYRDNWENVFGVEQQQEGEQFECDSSTEEGEKENAKTEI